MKLIVPAMTAMTLYLTVKVCSGRTVDWGGVVKYWFVSNGNLIYGWYVSEIICLYVAFFLCYVPSESVKEDLLRIRNKTVVNLHFVLYRQ